MSMQSSRRPRRFPVKDGLTASEISVICLLATGQAACGKEAARLMGRSTSTTLGYLSAARAKTGCRSTAHLVAWAWSDGLVHRELIAASRRVGA